MSLHPIKSRQKPKPGKGYARLRVEHGWETGEKKPWTPGKWTKRGILSLTILSIILASSFSYYQGIVVPSLSIGSSQYDPFQILWNGTMTDSLTGSGPTLQSSSHNDACSGASCAITVTLVSGYTAMVSAFITGSSGCSMTLSDTLLNTWSLQVSAHSVSSTNIRVDIWSSSPISTGGSSTITGSCSTDNFYELQVSQYSGVTKIGAATGGGNPLATTPLTDTRTITSGAISDVYEAGAFFLGSACGSCPAPMTFSPASEIYKVALGANKDPSLATAHTSAVSVGSNSFSMTISGLGGANVYYAHAIVELDGSKPNCPSGYHCVNSGLTANDFLQLNANSTVAGVTLSTGTIDLSTASSKELLFHEATRNSTALTATKPYGWFLTLNGTLPTQANYSPLNDSSVVFLIVVYPRLANLGNMYVYMQRAQGHTFLQDIAPLSNPNSYPTCPTSGSLFICNNSTSSYGSQFLTLGSVLNFTGSSGTSQNGFSTLCSGIQLTTLTACQDVAQFGNITPCAGITICQSTVFPWLNFQNQYHIGFWANSGQSGNILFGTGPTNTSACTSGTSNGSNCKGNSVYVWIPNPTTQTPSQTDTGGFFGWVGRSLGGAWNAVTGFIAPIAGPILGLGNSLLSVFISGLIQAGNLLIQGLTVLESVLVTVLNTMGSFLGFGNIGTNIQTLINSLVTFFTNGTFTNSFAFLGSGFTFLFNSGTIVVSWFNVAITFVTGGIAWASAGIGFVGTAAYWFFLGWSTLYGTIFIILWFIDLGDYGAQGGLIWFDTMRWLFFGTGIGFLIRIINLGLDMITYLVGLIPKPIIQMVAHAIPRIPIIEASGSPTFPDGHMEAARNGNVFTVLGWMVGFFFTVAYEGTTLPGSIGAFVPGAAASTSLLTNTLPLFEIMLFMGGLTLVFILPAKLVNFMPDLFEQNMPGRNIPISMRAQAPPRGPTHVGIRRAEKRFQGRLEKKLMERREIRAEFKKRLVEGRGLERP